MNICRVSVSEEMNDRAEEKDQSRHDKVPSGIIVLDKNRGISSYRMVAEIKRLFSVKKAGHTGTLDPFATGVLVVCISEATKIIPYLDEETKEYKFSVQFGVSTNTWDNTGEVVKREKVDPVPIDDLERVLHEFRGIVKLPVPSFSAVKIKGKRLYELARKGIDVDTPVRTTRIDRLELVSYNWPSLEFFVCCAKGTYVRSLAVSLGGVLGVPCHVSSLRRLKSGPFAIEEAVTLDELKSLVVKGRTRGKLISMNRSLSHLPEIEVSPEQASLIRNGRLPKFRVPGKSLKSESEEFVRLVLKKDDLVALGRLESAAEIVSVKRVFMCPNALSERA